MSVLATPGFDLIPSAERVPTASNYLTTFDFMSQYLPDTYEKEFERYGNRSISSFLRLVGAEMPSNSDLIKWSEQGRLHVKYTNCAVGAGDLAGASTATITVSDNLTPTIAGGGTTTGGQGGIAIRVGMTIMISANAGATTLYNKALVTDVTNPGDPAPAAQSFTVAYYEAAGQAFSPADTLTVFVYGSEYRKGSSGLTGSFESDSYIFENNPIIIRDRYEVNGSDMAQIGWIEVTSEMGASGYLWYLKSESDTRMRFDDHLETAMIEAIPADAGSGAAAALPGGPGRIGSQGVFYVVKERGNVFQGAPSTLADFDAIIQRLDKQGAIEENVLFVNRELSFDIDDMLAAQNSYGAGGTSYGLFDNDEEMALNLGFRGFRRGYDFYKSDWKYLNDAAMRGGIHAGEIYGLLVPAGSTSVYDQVLGKNAKRPFLHVRYRASETEDRRYKTWITGSAGGARTSDLDAMEVHFLSERAVCTLGANNFFLFEA
tara:strand:+ start:7000 stop:8463 length:1464 start_codon:yes stop_codon:yes gene_type:complete